MSDHSDQSNVRPIAGNQYIHAVDRLQARLDQAHAIAAAMSAQAASCVDQDGGTLDDTVMLGVWDAVADLIEDGRQAARDMEDQRRRQQGVA